MTQTSNFLGFTIQLRVPDIAAGRAFYEQLIGREPDLSPHDDFHEWELQPAAWLQLGEREVLPAYPLRFGVNDIAAEVAQMPARFGITCSEIGEVPALVLWCNFNDPWGNQLGFYQDLNVPV